MQFRLSRYRLMMHTGKLHLLLLPLLLALFSATSSAEAVRCEDQRGNTIFTDNRSLCFGNKKTVLVLKTSTELKPQGKLKTNYRIPERQYQVAHSDWTIYLEKSLAEGDKELASTALGCRNAKKIIPVFVFYFIH